MDEVSNNRIQLPDGQWIHQHNTYETDFVYNEIFVNNSYFKHGIKLNANAIVFDVGANIGLFSLYLMKNYPLSKIIAFEPSSEIYTLLKYNTAQFGANVCAYNIGLSDREEERQFYYYPGYSVISGFYVNKERDAEIIMSGAKTNNTEEDVKIKSLVNERLSMIQSFTCQMKTISGIIQESKLLRVDLLKIDVEGSELAVLKGVEKRDWRKIKQIVMEVHHHDDLSPILSLLNHNDFRVHVDEDPQFNDLGIYNLFAIAKTV